MTGADKNRASDGIFNRCAADFFLVNFGRNYTRFRLIVELAKLMRNAENSASLLCETHGQKYGSCGSMTEDVQTDSGFRAHIQKLRVVDASPQRCAMC